MSALHRIFWNVVLQRQVYLPLAPRTYMAFCRATASSAGTGADLQ